MWYVPSEEEVAGFMALPSVAAGGEKGINAEAYVKALTEALKGDEVKLDEKFEASLKDQFNSLASGEAKLVPAAQLRQLVAQTYLAPGKTVEQFVKILDRDGNGSVTVTEILESHSELEKAFPDLFRRLKAQEEHRLRLQRLDDEPLPTPKKEAKGKGKSAPAEEKKEEPKAAT